MDNYNAAQDSPQRRKEHKEEREEEGIYGLLAEFTSADTLFAATQETVNRGYARIEAYTPYPVHGLARVLGVTNRRLPLIVLGGGITGGVGALLMQWYSATIHYPLNVGGRPMASWPSFIPVTFEVTILVAGFAAVLGMFALNGLPQPYHPVFNVAEFAAASRDRFYLCIQAEDEHFDRVETWHFLEAVGAVQVFEVEK